MAVLGKSQLKHFRTGHTIQLKIFIGIFVRSHQDPLILVPLARFFSCEVLPGLDSVALIPSHILSKKTVSAQTRVIYF